MQKIRRLMDETSVSFEMFRILLSFIALGSESQISVFKQCRSNTQMSGLFFRGGGGGACAEAKIWREKKPKKLHTALRSAEFLASFISFYFEVLSSLAYGEKIIRLTSKNSVKLGEKLTSYF